MSNKMNDKDIILFAYISVSQPMCRDAQVCRQIFVGVPLDHTLSEKVYKTATFS
jgi:hypothetical protein